MLGPMRVDQFSRAGLKAIQEDEDSDVARAVITDLASEGFLAVASNILEQERLATWVNTLGSMVRCKSFIVSVHGVHRDGKFHCGVGEWLPAH